MVAASSIAIGNAATPKRIISAKVWREAHRLAIEAADEDPDDGLGQQRGAEAPFVEALGGPPSDRVKEFEDGGHGLSSSS